MARLLDDDERRLDLVLNQESLSCGCLFLCGWLLLLYLLFAQLQFCSLLRT